MMGRRYRRNPALDDVTDLAIVGAVGLGVFLLFRTGSAIGQGIGTLGSEAVQGIETGAATVGSWFANLFNNQITATQPQDITNFPLFQSNFPAWYQQVIVDGAPSQSDLQAAQMVLGPGITGELPGNQNALDFSNPNLFGQPFGQ